MAAEDYEHYWSLVGGLLSGRLGSPANMSSAHYKMLCAWVRHMLVRGFVVRPRIQSTETLGEYVCTTAERLQDKYPDEWAVFVAKYRLGVQQ